MQKPFLLVNIKPQIPIIAGVENSPPSRAPINKQVPANEHINVVGNFLFLIDNNIVKNSIGSNIITIFAKSGM